VIAMSERTTGILKPLMDRSPLLILLPEKTMHGGLDFNQPETEAAFAKAMDEANAHYALLAVKGSRAVVVSRREDLMPAQAGPNDCYCKTDRKSVAPGSNGANCPYDHRHIGTVRCR
jgi:hypothetical protein